MATCPECDFDDVDTEEFEDGDILNCPECGKALVFSGGELDFADEDDDLDVDDDDEELEDEDDLDDDDDEEEEDED